MPDFLNILLTSHKDTFYENMTEAWVGMVFCSKTGTSKRFQIDSKMSKILKSLVPVDAIKMEKSRM